MPTDSVPGAKRIRRLPLLAAVFLLLVSPASEPLAVERVGETERVVSVVRGILGPVTRELAVPDDVFSEEVIETGDEAATRIVFLDGTELTMGPRSRVTLDRYVYDPSTGAGELVMSFIGGVFEFASGLIPNAGYSLSTPFANLAIRGTSFFFGVFDRLQLIVRDGVVAVSAGGREILINNPFDCVVASSLGGVPEIRPVEECQALMEEIAITAALLIEPAAGTPRTVPAAIQSSDPFFIPRLREQVGEVAGGSPPPPSPE